MGKRLAIFLMSAAIGVTIMVFCVSAVSARKWVTDDNEYWQVQQVCRDGARLALINAQTTVAAPQPGQTIDVDLQPRLLTRPFDATLLDPDSGWLTTTESKADMAFYPLLSARYQFSETVYQAAPFYADLDDDGSDDPAEDYFLLYTTGVVHWPALPVGAAVLFPANFGIIVQQVADCSLNQLQLEPELTIDPAQFGADYSSVVSLDPANPDPVAYVEADDLLYEILAVPAAGSLTLDGVELAPGDQFSRTRLNAGVMQYRRQAPVAATQAISYRVRATYEGRLLPEMGVNPISPAVSRFGRFTVSVDGDHIVVDDALTNCTVRVSQNGAGEAADGPSQSPTLSADGRFVAFASQAANLVPGDSNGVADIFVYDRDADGDFSFYADEASCTPGPAAVYRASIAAGGAQADGASSNPLIAGNGAFVQFQSEATNLVPNAASEQYVHYTGFAARLELAPQNALHLPLFTG